MNRRRGFKYLPLFSAYACAYCGSAADTIDHTPPKCLLKKPYPQNLMTVPACRQCNTTFSQAEDFSTAVIAHVSFQEDLVDRLRNGTVARALARNARLKHDIESRINQAGYFIPDSIVLNQLGLVLTKCVQGLYYKHYGQTSSARDVQCIAIEHQHDVTPEDLLDAHCNPTWSSLWGEQWPEITPNPMALERAAIAWTHGEKKFPRWRPPKWIMYQPDIFEYTFRQDAEDKSLIWILDLRKTLTAAVRCPWPGRRGVG